MNTPTPTSDYLLLFRGTDWDKGLSPNEMQQVMTRLATWMEGLQRQGKLKASQPLGKENRLVSRTNGRTVSDGPFAESKEAIGGYIMVRAADLEEAVALAKQFPCLDYGVAVEVRPVVGECPHFQNARQQMAEAVA